MSHPPYFVGLDVGGTTMKGGVLDDSGKPLSSTSLPLPNRSRNGAKLGDFTILRTAHFGEVFRGIDWAPTN